MAFPILLFAALIVAAFLVAYSAAKILFALVSAALALFAWPVRAGMRRYAKELRNAKFHP